MNTIYSFTSNDGFVVYMCNKEIIIVVDESDSEIVDQAYNVLPNTTLEIVIDPDLDFEVDFMEGRNMKELSEKLWSSLNL